MACIAMKPVVDRLEREQQGRLEVIRVNVQDPAGKELAGRFGFEWTPTFLLFDGQGNLVWRAVGRIEPEAIERQLNDL